MKKRIGIIVIVGQLLMVTGLFADSGKISRTFSAINTAEQNGQITRQQAAEYRANLVIDSRRNPARFQLQSDAPMKCGLPLWRQIQQDWDLLGPDVQARLMDIQNRPSKQYTYDTPTGNFKLHYDETGSEAVYQPTVDANNNDVPDYVERVGEYFEESWAYLDSLGFDHVPSDGTRGGDSKYDIYMHSYAGAYGVTFPEGPTGEYPGRNAYYSHINIDPDFQGFSDTPDNNAKVTAVHEFFHAVQFVYDVGEQSWLLETSSTWVEDMLYDEVNQYTIYLSDVFSQPHLSITSTSGVHEYGNCIWMHHLTESKDVDLVNDIWTNSINEVALDAVDAAINSYDNAQTIATDYYEYAQWNFFTGSQRGAVNISSYEEATTYPLVSIYGFHSDYPVEDRTPINPPQRYGANYIRFTPSDAPKENLLLLLDGSTNAEWRYQIISKVDNTYEVIAEVDGDSEGDATIFVDNWPTLDDVFLIAGAGDGLSSGNALMYSAYSLK